MSYEYSTNGTILRINDFHLSFGEKVIIRNLNAEIKDIVRPNMEQGQVVALLGPSGIGKTQLFRAVSGLEINGGTIKGSVTLGENNVPVRAGIVGVVAQNYPLFRHRKVLDNLIVAGRRAGLIKEAAKDKAMALLEGFGLHDRFDHWPDQLSGGQKQRVAIAQQLMCSEHLLIMDEPFSGLDPVMVDKVTGLILQVAVKNEFNTTILSTHEISSAVAVADTIWLMGRDRAEDGSIVPGAYIKKEINLIEEGLAWRPDIRKLPRFRDLVSELRDEFKGL